MTKSSAILIVCLLFLASCDFLHARHLATPEPEPVPAFVPVVNHAVRYLDKHDNIVGTKLEVANAALTVPVGGEMMIAGDFYFSVDNEYQSASGKLCKEITIFNAGALLFENICYDNVKYTMEYLEDIFAKQHQKAPPRERRRMVQQHNMVMPDEGI